ncbi:MmgE/Prp family protein [Marinobacterium zhoushanense]|uniref:MmgE/Prp family protein n=1 Tax=Marinobacterium zhoushanense TaxID=1679163 RepID=A0ABQ1JZ04_9GAMM|nr:MmgE/PrpD family protein [Marinobacterium zhoushanense]GGB81790.1 MmgE/Prp family protein [Marinobacterium zhoushanense]
MDAIIPFADHVVSRSYVDFSTEAITAAKTFLLDALGVGISGVHGQWGDELSETIPLWGSGNDSRVLGRGTRHPCAISALANAFQIHNSEFDCVHEGAVVHPMASIVGAVLAVIDREGGVSGQRLIEAIVLGADVSCGIGVASNSPLRFFRPGTAGGFGATAAVAKLLGFDKETLLNSFGTLYGQTCGTMQSHEEGSMLLALQIGFNTRNAVVSCDLAARGLVAPRNVLEGRFGFFNLFEGEYDIAPVISSLGHSWRIEEVSHKPFPTGRATQGAIEAAIRLKQKHSFDVENIQTVYTHVTPLTARLVGRPMVPGMAPNYARLCLQYSVARALLQGALEPGDFRTEVLDNQSVYKLAQRVNVIVEPNDDPNALGPSCVQLLMRDGQKLGMAIDDMPGSPSNPLTRDQHLNKFRKNLGLAPGAVSENAAERVIALVDNLEHVQDARALLDLLCPV